MPCIFRNGEEDRFNLSGGAAMSACLKDFKKNKCVPHSWGQFVICVTRCIYVSYSVSMLMQKQVAVKFST